MPPLLLPNGRALLIAGGLFTPLASAPVVMPNTIAGLASWWDAGVAPSGGWTASVSAVPDKVGSTALLASSPAKGRPRLSGSLGGLGLETRSMQGYDAPAWAPILVPTMDPDWLLTANSVAFGSGGAATVDLVFTRPNLRQAFAQHGSSFYFNGSFIGGQSPLILIAGVVCLGLTSTGTGDSLIAFPNSGSPTTLITTIDPRITASVRMRGSHAGGWDFFLNGTKLNSSPVPSQLGSAPTTAAVQFLGSGNAASAQCYFHEAMVWPRALTDGECATVDAYLNRWGRQTRQAASLVLVGQSNAGYTWSNSSGMRDFSAGVQYLTGLVSFTVIAVTVPGAQSTPGFPIGGNGLIGNTLSYLTGGLTDDPATLQFNPNGGGAGTTACIASLPAYAQKDIAGFLALYSENDSGIRWTQRANFAAVVKQFIHLFRAIPHAGPAWDATNTVGFWNSDIPFGDGEGHAAHKAAIQAVTADASNNTTLWLLQGADGNTNGATYDPATGLFSGGDSLHVDYADDLRHTYYGVEPVARKLLTIGRGSAVIPANLPMVGGPHVASVTWEGAAVTGNAATPSALITVQHDAGNDLRVPLQATTGLGWVLLDGGVPGTSPTIKATACVRVSPTTLRVTFASAPTQALPSVGLYYIYATTDSNPQFPGRPGRGNAVTDNYSDTTAVPAAPGFDIGADLGPAYRGDRPLAATMLGLALG